jgi:hypothetical protein
MGAIGFQTVSTSFSSGSHMRARSRKSSTHVTMTARLTIAAIITTRALLGGGASHSSSSNGGIEDGEGS